MEEMHHIHKAVPFGYWVMWVEPAWRAFTRRWRDRHSGRSVAGGLDQLSAPH